MNGKYLDYKKISRALYVGRFQPFHLGHLEAVKYILRDSSEVVIVIGSAQHSYTLENPFTAGERAVMIRLALNEAGIDSSRYFIIPVTDLDIHGIWVSWVASFVPPFDVVYTNEPLTKRLFMESGFKVMSIPFFKREVCSATEVRRRIMNNENWEELIPKSIVEFIREKDGVKRLQELAKSDKISA